MFLFNIFHCFLNLFKDSYSNLDRKKFPNHIAFIMDGNRRWAKKNFLPKIIAYSRGVDSMIEKIKFGLKNNIKYMTFYCISRDNLTRSSEDLDDFFSNIRNKLDKFDIKKMIENGVFIKTIGDLSLLPKDIKEKMEFIVEKTSSEVLNKKITITLAVAYSSRHEIVDAVKKIVQSGIAPDNINPKMFSDFLDTSGTPDPDLFIRTGDGNIRLSDFLLWQLSYTELYFTEKYWPEFQEKDLYIAISDFIKRKRNYGK